VINNDSKNIYNVISQIKKILKKIMTVSTKTFSSTTINIYNNQKLSINSAYLISEGSCDTEDWSSNNAENSALITGINYFVIYFTIEKCYFK